MIMEEKMMIVVLVLFGILLLGLFMTSSSDTIDISENNTAVYLVYSETCSHCHELIQYLSSEHSTVDVVATLNGAQFKTLLDKHKVEWGFGVPMMFTIIDGEFVGLEGFPSGSQDVAGYFMGKEFERGLCESRGGEQYLEQGDYKFCKLPTGFMMGNKYSVDYLVGLHR